MQSGAAWMQRTSSAHGSSLFMLLPLILLMWPNLHSSTLGNGSQSTWYPQPYGGGLHALLCPCCVHFISHLLYALRTS